MNNFNTTVNVKPLLTLLSPKQPIKAGPIILIWALQWGPSFVPREEQIPSVVPI